MCSHQTLALVGSSPSFVSHPRGGATSEVPPRSMPSTPSASSCRFCADEPPFSSKSTESCLAMLERVKAVAVLVGSASSAAEGGSPSPGKEPNIELACKAAPNPSMDTLAVCNPAPVGVRAALRLLPMRGLLLATRPPATAEPELLPPHSPALLPCWCPGPLAPADSWARRLVAATGCGGRP